MATEPKSSTAFTRGPWTFNKRGLRVYGGSTGNVVVANIPLYPDYEATGRLIAAAPDLFEALGEMVMAAGGVGLDAKSRRKSAMDRALVALAKARGER